MPNLKVYLENNWNKINYRGFKKKDYYIGSGAIESGNKMAILQTMKQCGMRWSVSGRQQIAALRAKYAPFHCLPFDITHAKNRNKEFSSFFISII